MPTFISKPIMWNTYNYRLPSGVRVNSGFPSQEGYGHEEWNNSDALLFHEDGVKMRAFHTEGVGNAIEDSGGGDIFVFMYASHDSRQELVGVAACATNLVNDKLKRQRLTEQLRLDRLRAQAWAVPLVRELARPRGYKEWFNDVWDENLHWIPNWICPEETYIWFENPVVLNPIEITGKTKFLSMFGTYTNLSHQQAIMMIDSVPNDARNAKWSRIRNLIDEAGAAIIQEDIGVLNERRIPVTQRKQLIDARLGQGLFRKNVEGLWVSACCVSGCKLRELLRASHILPWKVSTDSERLDGENGLLLTADLDALFDKGLIAFSDAGEMLIADRVSISDRELLQLPRSLRSLPSPNQANYLRNHRQRWGFE